MFRKYKGKMEALAGGYISKLFNRYPDLNMISDIYRELQEKHKKFSSDAVGDDKYRPLPLMLAVLYKIQERNDTFFKEEGLTLDAEQKNFLPLLGYFWNLQNSLGKKIRESVNTVAKEEVADQLERNRLFACEMLGVDSSCLPQVWVSELGPDQGLEGHCSDYILFLDHPLRCLTLILLGTRIFPRPNPPDIIMDLTARADEFQEGVAHEGMATGTRNCLNKCFEKIQEILEQNPGYSLTIIGYSLGAGLAQLVHLEIESPAYRARLPANLRIRSIVYGCPPVYGSEGRIPAPRNLIVVQNHNDGLSGASLKTINDVFLKTQAIQRLNLRRRTLFRLVLSKSCSNGDEDGEDDGPDDELDDDDDEPEPETGGEEKRKSFFSLASMKTKVANLVCTKEDIWRQVEEAIAGIAETDLPRLYQVSNTILKMKKLQSGEVAVKQFSGPELTWEFSKKIRFKSSMFDNHMPWAYSNLFTGMESVEGLDLTLLDGLCGFEDSSSSLYPDLSTFSSE